MNSWANPVETWCKANTFLAKACSPIAPTDWITPFDVKLTLPQGRLLQFSNDGPPIVFSPPQAGGAPQIVDFAPGQSLVNCAVKLGFSVYAWDWSSCTYDRKDELLDDYIMAMHRGIEAIGEPVHEFGPCQGGYQSLIHAALFPDDVLSITQAGTPNDFHCGTTDLAMYTRMMTMEMIDAMIALGGGLMDGAWLGLGFKMIGDPAKKIFGKYFDLFNVVMDGRCDDLCRWENFHGWFDNRRKLPGAMMRQVARDLFLTGGNKLVKGCFEVLGKAVDLKKVRQPLTLIMGSDDDITSPCQCYAVVPYTSTDDAAMIEIPRKGHIGSFTSRDVMGLVMPHVFSRILKLHATNLKPSKWRH
jgi:poly(3-hydroxyalkanoate) synthetase